MSKRFLHSNKLIKIKPVNQLKVQTDVGMKDDIKHLQSKIQKETTYLSELKSQQQQLLAETKQSIEKAKAEWEKEKELLEQEIRKKGYEAGFTRGEEAGFTTYKAAIQKVNELSEKAVQDYHETLENSMPDALQIAVHVAEKIIKEELKANKALYQSFVKEAIEDIKTKERLIIYVPPELYGMIIEQKQELLQILENETNLLIKMKEDLSPSGCLIEHSTGMIDIGMDSQLNEIRKVLQEFVMESKQ